MQLRNINVNHFKMVEAMGLQTVASRSASMALTSYSPGDIDDNHEKLS
jgi:hypothetical protein